MPRSTSTAVSFRVPTDQANLVTALSAASGRSMSSIFRDALSRELRSTLAAGAEARAR